ncbi:MAG: oxygenase MpaB family protein [Solirubrobacteraceae bacterium]
MLSEGYFPRGRSVLREVHEQRAVGLLYGQRALAIGACNPLNYVGTAEHTHSRLTPFRRLAHTGKWFEQVYFGSRPEADRVLASVAQMHDRVHGELPHDAGPHAPAGTPYSAWDPPLMLWTIAVAADSALHFYELLVRTLSAREREAFWQDYLLFGELFGLPRSAAPGSYGEFREYWHARLSSPELHLTKAARQMGHAVAFEIPMPAQMQLAKRLHDLLILGSMPARVRELYGLDWFSAHRAAHGAAVRTVRAARPLTPGVLACGGNARFFELVERTERSRIERGVPTPQIA